MSVLVVIGAATVWAAGTRSVSGHFTSTVVTGAECASAVDLCTAGTLTGGVKGSKWLAPFRFDRATGLPYAGPPADLWRHDRADAAAWPSGLRSLHG